MFANVVIGECFLLFSSICFPYDHMKYVSSFISILTYLSIRVLTTILIIIFTIGTVSNGKSFHYKRLTADYLKLPEKFQFYHTYILCLMDGLHKHKSNLTLCLSSGYN